MRFIGIINVEFKKSVLEPQGKAIELSFSERGFTGIQNIRVGKVIEITLERENEAEAKVALQKMADDLLYNPVMEVCTIEVRKA